MKRRRQRARREVDVRQRYAALAASVRAEAKVARVARADEVTRAEAARVDLDARLSDFDVRLEAAVAACEAVARDREAQPCGAETIAAYFDRALARVDAMAVAADAAIGRVLDRVRSAKLPRTELAAIARAVTARLGDIERALDDERAAREAEAGEVEAWRQRAAIAARSGGRDLIAGARRRVAQRRAKLLARDVEIRAYRAVAERLREIGLAVLAAAE